MGSIRNRRKKLTTLLTDVNSRIRNVELRSTSQQAADAGSGETDENFVTPGSFLRNTAPSTWKRVVAGFYYSKQVTGLQNDRVEIFLNTDAGLEKDEFLEVSGINSPIEVSKKRKVLGVGQAVGAYRNNKSWFSAIPAGVTHALLYSVGADPGFTQARVLQTKSVISSFSATIDTATIVFGQAHNFNVKDVIDVSELGGSLAGIDGLFFVDTVPSTTSITYKFSRPISAPIASTPATPNRFVYATVHEYVELGDSWINTSTDPDSLFIWDGLRWIVASDPGTVKKDDLDPKPPTNLQVESLVYPNETGFSRASATFSWTAPTQNTDDSPLTDLAGYDIQWAGPTITGATGDKWASAGGYAFVETSIDIPDLPSGQNVQFRVRAIDTGGRKSTFASITKLMGTRSDVLLAPSDPIVDTRLGTVTVRWNGEQQDRSVPPNFLDYIEVHVSGPNQSNFTPSASTLQGRIDKTGNDFFVITDLPYNETRFVRILFVDQDGKKGLPSRQVQITIKPLVDTDIIGKILSGANIVPGSITASESIIGNTITGNLIQALTIETGSLEANIITADKINVGAITAVAIRANAITTEKINAGAITADTIAANAITAAKIRANAITAVKIASDAITADKINAGAVTADAIAANVISASKIVSTGIYARTIGTSASGKRVILEATNDTLIFYDGVSTLPVGTLQGLSGSGMVVSASSGGSRLILGPSAWRLGMTNGTEIVYQTFRNRFEFNGARIRSDQLASANNRVLYATANGDIFFGQVANTAFTTTSDRRLKSNIEDSELGLEMISRLKPVKFNLDIKGFEGRNRQYGLIAQDILETLTQLGVSEPTDIVQEDLEHEHAQIEKGQPALNVDYTQFIPILIRSVQELSAKVEFLETELRKKEGLS